MDDLLHLDDGRKIKLEKFNLTYEGVIPRLKRSLGSKDPENGAAACAGRIRAHLHAQNFAPIVRVRASTRRRLAAGSAARASPRSRPCRFPTSLPSSARIKAPHAQPMIDALATRLENLATIGLGYLSLDRESSTLSGGESQRVKMVRHLGSSLTDITYVFDEPSVGLHPHDVGRLAGLMQQLRDKGNTVLIVEHKPDMIAIADHVVDMGPLAGAKGGEIVYEGNYKGLLKSGTLTGEHILKHQPIKTALRKPRGELRIKGASR